VCIREKHTTVKAGARGAKVAHGREVFGVQFSVFSRAVKNEHATLPFPLSGLLGGVLSFRFVSFKRPDFLHPSYLSFPVSGEEF